MKASIVIPVFNEAEYIESCLESLVNQKEPADEIIIVDNNSTDSTRQIVKKYPVRIISEKKQGIIPSRNTGFNEAHYDIIVRTDADVIAPANWIQKIKSNFKKYKIDALSGPVVWYDFSHKTPLYTKAYFDFTKQLQKGKHTLIGPNMAITRAIWYKVRDHLCTDDAQVHEDQDLAIHILEIGGKIRVDPTLINQSSARRLLHNPKSFFIEYPTKFIRTHKNHRQ